MAAVPHLRKLFKHFDMCIAAARLYTRHHQPSVAANQAAAIATAAVAAAAAATAAASARRAEDETHGESSEQDDVLLASVDKPTPAKDIGGRYFQHTPFSPGSSLSFPTAMPDSPCRARKYVRRGVLSRGGDGNGEDRDDTHDGEEGDDDDPYHNTLASILDIVYEERGEGAAAGDLSRPEIDFSSHETLLAAVEENGTKLEELRVAQDTVNESVLASIADLHSKYAALVEENKQLQQKQKLLSTAHETAHAREAEHKENLIVDHVSTELQLVLISLVVLLVVYNVVYWLGSSVPNPAGM